MKSASIIAPKTAVETSFLAALILLTLPLLHGGGFGLASPVSAAIWCLAIVGVLATFVKLTRWSKLRFYKSDLTLFIGVIFFGTATLWRWETLTEPQLLLLLLLSIFIFVIARHRESIKFEFFIEALAFGAIIQAVYAWLLFAGTFTFLGLETDLLVGGFLHTNVLASFLSTGLAAFGIALTTGKNISTVRRSYLFSGILLLSITIVSIGSRTGWIGGIAVVILSCLHLQPIDRRKFLLVLLLGLIFALYLQSIIPQLNDRVAGRFEATTNGRFPVWRVTFDLILSKPILGYGFNNFAREHTEAWAQLVYSGIETHSSWNFEHPHNFLLNWWFIGGLGSVMGFLSIAYWHAGALLKLSQQEAIIFGALMVPIYLHMQTEFPFQLSPLHLIIVILILALLGQRVSAREAKDPIMVEVSKSLRATIVTMMAFACLILVNESRNSWLIQRVMHLPNEYASDLQGVTLPIFSLNRYTDAVAIASLQEARRTGNVTLYSFVAKWATEKVKTTPKPTIYEALLEAEVSLGNTEKAIATYQRMLFLFPNYPFNFELKEWEGALQSETVP